MSVYDDYHLEPQAGKFVKDNGSLQNLFGSDGFIPTKSNLQVGGVDVSDSVPLPVTLATGLDSEIDTINVAKMSKAAVVEKLSAIITTTTSTEQDCRGFNTLSVECAVSAITSGNWVIEVLGCAISGGTFGRCFDINGNEMHVGSLNADLTCKDAGITTNENLTFTFKGISNYIKIRATRTTDGTLTCKITPMNA